MAGLLVGAFTLTGVGLTISNDLVKLAGGQLFLLVIFVSALCIVMGMAMSGMAIYVIVAIFIAPSLITMGVNPLAAHMFVYWMAHTALITPPVGNAFMIGATIAGAPLMATGWQACRLGVAVYMIPLTWILDPATLMIGTPIHILLATVFTAGAIYFVTCALRGLCLDPSDGSNESCSSQVPF